MLIIILLLGLFLLVSLIVAPIKLPEYYEYTPPKTGRAAIIDIYNRILCRIRPQEFYFGQVIREVDENNCGTVCCVAGWMPQLTPEYGFIQTRYDNTSEGNYVHHLEWDKFGSALLEIGTRLRISRGLFEYLFIGNMFDLYEIDYYAPRINRYATLFEVRGAWEYIINNWKPEYDL